MLPLVARRMNDVAIGRTSSAGGGDVSGHVDVADALMGDARKALIRKEGGAVGGRPLGVNGATHEVFLPFDADGYSDGLSDSSGSGLGAGTAGTSAPPATNGADTHSVVTGEGAVLSEVVARAASDPTYRAYFRRAYLETVVCQRMLLDSESCFAAAKSWGISWG